MAQKPIAATRPSYRKSKWLSTNTAQTDSISCISTTIIDLHYHNLNFKDNENTLSIVYNSHTEALAKIATITRNLFKAVNYIKSLPEAGKKVSKKFSLGKHQGFNYTLCLRKFNGDLTVSIVESILVDKEYGQIGHNVDVTVNAVTYITENVIFNTFYRKREHIVKLLETIISELMRYAIWINKQKRIEMTKVVIRQSHWLSPKSCSTASITCVSLSDNERGAQGFYKQHRLTIKDCKKNIVFHFERADQMKRFLTAAINHFEAVHKDILSLDSAGKTHKKRNLTATKSSVIYTCIHQDGTDIELNFYQKIKSTAKPLVTNLITFHTDGVVDGEFSNKKRHMEKKIHTLITALKQYSIELDRKFIKLEAR